MKDVFLLGRSLYARMERVEALMGERWETVKRQRQDHSEIHAQEELRLQEARTEMERRLEQLNELRREVTTDRGLLVRREFLDATLDAMEKSVAAQRMADKIVLEKISEDVRLLQNSAANLQGRLWALGVGLTIVVVIVNVVIRFIH